MHILFSYFVTLIINIESVFLFIGYMNGLWRDRHNNTCSYRSTLFADLNLEITYVTEGFYEGRLIYNYILKIPKLKVSCISLKL